jgi:general secretion pathway protein D
MKLKRLVFALCAASSIVGVPSFAAPGEPAKKAVGAYEFVNQNVRDILFALSTYARQPIVADDTVSGTASFQFAGGDFGVAFDSFLSANRLYVSRGDDVWTVSKIRLSVDGTGLVTVDALDASLSQLVERIAMRTGTTVVQDILPALKLSLHVASVTPLEAIEVLMKPYPDYAVIKEDSFIQIRKLPSQLAAAASLPAGNVRVRQAGGLFEVSFERAKVADALSALFAAAGREYSSFARGDQVIERVSFAGKTFEAALRLILEQSGAEPVFADGVWYVLPAQQSEIIKRVRDGRNVWARFDLSYLSGKECAQFFQARYPGIVTIVLPAGTGLLALLDPDAVAGVREYAAIVDASIRSVPIRLKYVKTEELLKNLPPSARREDLVDAGNGNTVFFCGSDQARARFLRDLETVDRPKTRIRYDLLVIQAQDSSDLTWGFNVDASELAPGDTTMVTGSLGNLLRLNFDVITVFGYQFAAKMNLALAENRATVFADTTLYGLSGQEIKFQNTNTYRYRDYSIDSKTGESVYTGVTREIVSGLVLNVNGWASGDGMITSSVTVSVSKRGADVSAKVGNPPPTSEKVLTTQVRSRSGETIVLSGLRQNDSTVVEERMPLVSRIPFLGWLFRKTDRVSEHSQMVVYLVPHIDLACDGYTDAGLRTASAYEKYVAPFLGGGK